MVAVLVGAIGVAVLSVLYQIHKCTRRHQFKTGTLPEGVLPSETEPRHGLFDNMCARPPPRPVCLLRSTFSLLGGPPWRARLSAVPLAVRIAGSGECGRSASAPRRSRA